MTNKQAIELLKWFGEYNDIDYHGGDMIENDKGDRFYRVVEEDLEAFDMAIKALSQQTEDAISRQAAISDIKEMPEWHTGDAFNADRVIRHLKDLPSVTPKQRAGYCKDCKYFEYDSVAKVDGIPLILAHEICKRWGDGCKTKEDGYCFLFEPQESEGKE